VERITIIPRGHIRLPLVERRIASATVRATWLMFAGSPRLVGNDHRLIVAAAYRFGALYIKFVGTHAEYDTVDASHSSGPASLARFHQSFDRGVGDVLE